MPHHNALILEHQNLVRAIAAKLWRKYHLSHMSSSLDYEDMVSWAQFGLIEAAERFEHDRGAKFSTFATHRVRGAILDGLRAYGWQTRRPIPGRHLTTFSDAMQVTDEGEETPDLSQQLVDDSDFVRDLCDFDEEREVLDAFWGFVQDKLSDSDRQVVEARLAGRSLANAGAAVGVTESRACQIMSRVVERFVRVRGL